MKPETAKRILKNLTQQVLNSDQPEPKANITIERQEALMEALKALEARELAEEGSEKQMPLICLRCKKDIPLSYKAFHEVSYTHYSYCENCLRAGLKALREQERPKLETAPDLEEGTLKPYPPKTWIRAAEINEKIREEVNRAVAEALKKEHDKRLLEAIREIVSADFFREMVDCLVFRAEKRREGAKNDE